MAFLPKRNSYSIEYKINVLEHYFKTGGDRVVGNKAETAAYFKIGKKTVHRWDFTNLHYLYGIITGNMLKIKSMLLW